MKIFRVFRELLNYFFIKRVIKHNSKSEKWNELKLRHGWFGTIYTVINLPPEVFESEEPYHRVFVLEKIKPISDYFASLNLLEIVTVRLEKIDKLPGVDMKEDEQICAFLVRFIPLYRDLTWSWIIKWSFLIGVFTWLQLKYSVVQNCWLFIEWVLSKIQSL